MRVGEVSERKKSQVGPLSPGRFFGGRRRPQRVAPHLFNTAHTHTPDTHRAPPPPPLDTMRPPALHARPPHGAAVPPRPPPRRAGGPSPLRLDKASLSASRPAPPPAGTAAAATAPPTQRHVLSPDAAAPAASRSPPPPGFVGMDVTRVPTSSFGGRHSVAEAQNTPPPPPTTTKPPPPRGHGRAATPEGEAARKANISAAMKGRLPWNAGRRHSPETIARIRATTAAAMARPEVKAKVDAGRGRRGKVHHSDETIAKIKATMQASADAAARAAGRPTRAEREAAKEARAAERHAKKEAVAAEAAAKAEERRDKREAVAVARAARARRAVTRGSVARRPAKLRGGGRGRCRRVCLCHRHRRLHRHP